MKWKMVLIIISVFLPSLAFASNYGYDNPTLPKLLPPEKEGTNIVEGANYTINTNASEWWITSDGHADNINTTQMNVDGDGLLSILTGWLTDLFYTKDQVDALNGTWEDNIGNDTRGVTLTVCASDSKDTSICNYVCDGTADESEINTAINAIPSNGGKVILLEGIYNLDGNINMKDKVMLQGMGTGTFLNAHQIYTSEINDIVIKDMYFNTTSVHLELSTSNVEISNIYFKDSGITFDSFDEPVDRLKVTNCYFDGESLNILDADDSYISNNILVGSSGTAIDLQGTDRTQVLGNIINNTADYGIRLQDSDETVISSNNIISTNKHGILITTPLKNFNNVISGNIIKSSNLSGIHIENGRNTMISSNKIQDSTKYEITLAGSAINTMIIGNNLEGTHAGTINDTGINTTIIGNFPGGSSMEIQTATGQEIKMKPEGTLTQTLYPENTTMEKPIVMNENNIWLSNTSRVYAEGCVTIFETVVT